MKTQPNLIEASWRIFVIATCCLVVISTDFELPAGMFESFHHGEYFALLVTLLAGQPGLDPLTLHGALDYIPGLLALKIFGQSTYFFPTWLIYRLLDFIAVIIFLALAFGFTKNKPNKHLVVLATALIAPWLVGYRDVVLLLSIYLYFLIQQKKHSINNLLLEACFGITVAFSLFWSYDRGITTVVSLGAACIIHGYKNRFYLLSMVVFFATVIFLGYLSPQYSIGNYLSNIKTLVETSSQWSFGWTKNTVILTSFLGFSNILTVWLLGASMSNSKISSPHIADSISLILLSLFLFKIGSNRADITHFFMGLWGPLLSGLYWYSNRENIKLNFLLKIAWIIFLGFILILGYKFRLIIFIPISVIVATGLISVDYPGARTMILSKLFAVTLAIPLLYAVYSISGGIHSGKYNWVNYLSSPQPNQNMVSDGIRWVFQELIHSGSDCVFDLSNNGVINGLTNLPACSRFIYPVYANQHYEEELINSLKNKQPKAIVSSSTYWSFSIDQKTMPTRFPNLYKIILKEYTDEKCSFGYCVRYLRGQNAL